MPRWLPLGVFVALLLCFTSLWAGLLGGGCGVAAVPVRWGVAAAPAAAVAAAAEAAPVVAVLVLVLEARTAAQFVKRLADILTDKGELRWDWRMEV